VDEPRSTRRGSVLHQRANINRARQSGLGPKGRAPSGGYSIGVGLLAALYWEMPTRGLKNRWLARLNRGPVRLFRWLCSRRGLQEDCQRGASCGRHRIRRPSSSPAKDRPTAEPPDPAVVDTLAVRLRAHQRGLTAVSTSRRRRPAGFARILDARTCCCRSGPGNRIAGPTLDELFARPAHRAVFLIRGCGRQPACQRQLR